LVHRDPVMLRALVSKRLPFTTMYIWPLLA
jgi:hypothetical protein